MIEQINHIAGLWWSGAIAMFWQVGVLILLIGCVDLIIRRWAWPQLRYALWLMVLLKLVLPPTIYLSTSITSGLQPLARQIVAKEIHRENLDSATAMILANLETAVVESPVEAVFSGDHATERQPALVYTRTENVAGKSLNAASVKLIWQAYVMTIWLAGMFVLGGLLTIKLLHLRKEDLPPASTASLPESFYDSLTRCAERLGLRRVPKVVLTRRVACPAVFGMVRPVLLMPVGYLAKMTRSDTEHMLLHELAHIKRGDLCVHGFYMLLQIVYWYNPLLWLVRGQMHHLRELCCDATVARLLKERISEYRQTLIDVARRFLTKPSEPGLGLLGLFEDSNRLLVRLNWLKKETWRYQKMKKLTIITTIVLMLAFVLPMAQAQDKPATEPGSAETVKTDEQTSQSENTAEVEQKLKQNQQQLSQNMRELEVRLQQLQSEKMKLQKELQVMAQAKGQASQATTKAKEAKNKAEKASKGAEKAKDMAAKAKASAHAHKAEVDAKQWEQYAKEMEVWSQQWANSEQFKQWQKEMELWAKEFAEAHQNAESSGDVFAPALKHRPMPVMPPMPAMPPMPVEVVAPDVVAPAPPAIPVVSAPTQPQAKDKDNRPNDRAEEVLITSTFIDNDLVLEVLPFIAKRAGISIIPDESVTGLFTGELKDVPLDTALEIILAGTPYTYKKTKYYYLVCPRKIAGPTPVLPNTTGTKRNIEIKKDKDGKYLATTEMHFVSKVQPGKPFVVRNSLGNIILKPSKGSTCDVRAVIRSKAETDAEAREMVEQVGMNVNSSDEGYYLKPVKQDGDKWNNLNVDFYITVPLGVLLDVKSDLGNIEISNLQGQIKAATNLGSIKAVNTTGDIELYTKMGKIEFVAPKSLSAKLKAQTKMGEIESELPLEINKSDMFKRTAEGTIGTGQANIKMATDMGKISLKWQPSSQDELKI